MKYAHIGKDTNRVLGWYSDNVHKAIPLGSIVVEDEDWMKALEINANYYDKDTKTFIVKDFKTLDELKALKIKKINKLCELFIVGGFKSSALGEEYFYYSTLEEQTTLNSLINLGFDSNFKAQKISLVEGVEVKGERKQYPHTLTQLKEVLVSGAIHIKAQIDKKDELEVLINNATTAEELELIEW